MATKAQSPGCGAASTWWITWQRRVPYGSRSQIHANHSEMQWGLWIATLSSISFVQKASGRGSHMFGCQFKMCFHVFCKNHLDTWSPSQQNSSKDSSYKCADYDRIISYMTNFQFKTMISIDKIPTMWEVLPTFFPRFWLHWRQRHGDGHPGVFWVSLGGTCLGEDTQANSAMPYLGTAFKSLLKPPTSFILGCFPSWFPVINMFIRGIPDSTFPSHCYWERGHPRIQVWPWHTFLHTRSNPECLHVLTFWQDVMFSRNELTLGTESFSS